MKAEKWFAHTKLFHALMQRWSHTIKVPLTRLYDAVGWPLYLHYADLAVQVRTRVQTLPWLRARQWLDCWRTAGRRRRGRAP